MNDNELYLNVPEGYPIDRKIAKSDIHGLKSFLISNTPDDQLQDWVREMNDEQIVQTCLDNNFTFDEVWLGYREVRGSL
jgi:hypothetical protein